MSDTPTPNTPGNINPTPPESAVGRSDIRFTPEIQPREGEVPLTEEEAVDVLAGRFVGRVGLDVSDRIFTTSPSKTLFGGDKAGVSETRRNLLHRLVRMLPESHRTTSVLSFIDFRPLLSDMMITEQQARTAPRAYYFNDVPVLAEERVEAGKLLIDQNKQIEQQAQLVLASREEAAVAAGQPTMTPEERQRFVNTMVYGYRESTQLPPTPALELEATDAAASVSERDADRAQLEQSGYGRLYAEAGGLGELAADYQWMQQSELEWSTGMNMMDWNKILQSEADKAAARAAGVSDVPQDFMVDVGGILPSDTAYHPSLSDLATGRALGEATQIVQQRARGQVRLLDAFNMLNSTRRTPQEIENLQDKLLAAGYLDEDDMRYRGSAQDDATIDAWHKLVRDSVAMRKPLPQLLAEATLALRKTQDDEDKKRTRDIVLTSSVGIQTMADSMGQMVLGRKLSGQDQAALVQFIHSLERRQGALMTNTDAEGNPIGDFVEDIDINAEIQNWIEKEHGAEAGAYDVLEQFDAFQQIARRRG